MRILYVEDHPDSARYLKLLLERYGHVVDVAHTAAEAKVFCIDRIFDLWIIDVGLPDAHGGNLLRSLRRMADTKAVALTGFALPQDVAEGKEDGFDEYLLKPVMVDDILGMLDRMSDVRTFSDTSQMPPAIGQSGITL
jgi:two-component system, sensor histidine kinase